jgi:hypothetical protein
MATQTKMSDEELAMRLRFANDISLRAIELTLQRKPDPLASALREVRAEWLAAGMAVPKQL